MSQVQFEQLVRVIREAIGGRGVIQAASPSTGDVWLVMYDAFSFKCGLDEQYGSFGIILPLGENAAVRSFLGRDISMNADEKSVRESLALVDEYCRFRLPDKYLEAFESSDRAL